MRRHCAAWVLLFILFSCGVVVRCGSYLDVDLYGNFPKLFDYDDFEDCRTEYQEHYVYCIVRARIKPDPNSHLWQNLSIYSEDYRHYDRRVQERGICVQNCEKLLYDGEIHRDTNVGHSYADLFLSCINQRLQKHHNLQIEPDIDIYHCYSKANESPPFDILEILFILVIAVLLILVAYSTWYDMQLQMKQRFPENFFAKSHETKQERLLTSFSLPRNIRRLKDPVDTDIRRELHFLESFRFLQMHRVILLHIVMALAKAPKVNPHGTEEKLYRPLIIHYVADFQNYVQTFFSISGMLLAINFLEHTRKHPKFSMRFFWERLRARLYRIIPAYAFVLLLEVSITRHFMNGPLAQSFIGESQATCRRGWWNNLLFINNYVGTLEPCLIQSWYLAADLQLFIFALGTLMAIWRWPLLKKYIFGAAFAWGLGFTPIVTYILNLPPMMTEDLKLANKYNFGHGYFLLYQPFHVNIPIYFAGMLAGFIYHQFRENRKLVLNSQRMTVVFRVALFLYLFTVLTDSWVVKYMPSIPPIALAIYATCFKYAWGLLTTVIQLKTALLPQRSSFKSFFSHPLLTTLGKLCYSFYLIHFTIIVQVVGSAKQPIYFSIRGVFEYLMTINMWILMLGFLLCVLIELPSNMALRELL